MTFEIVEPNVCFRIYTDMKKYENADSGVRAQVDKVELLAGSVATGRLSLPDARKAIKTYPHDERIEFEWQVCTRKTE